MHTIARNRPEGAHTQDARAEALDQETNAPAARPAERPVVDVADIDRRIGELERLLAAWHARHGTAGDPRFGDGARS